MQQNSEISTNKYLQSKIRSIITQASREKLLPKIMWNAAKQFGSKKLISYQKSVRKQYENQLKTPVKYDPEAAKSDRQKFRDKVVRLMNNQLEIDYFQNIKERDKTLVTYHGKQIEQCKIETKKQFEMFKNFNEKRFKQTYTNLFDDKLEVAYDQMYQNKAKRCKTLHVLESQPNRQEKIKTEVSQISTKIKRLPTTFQLSKTPTKRREIQIPESNNRRIIYFNEKKVVGHQIDHHQQQDVAIIMRNIGNFDDKMSPKDLALTKESINKWLKNMYEKSHRIVDFLELKNVINFNQFWNISKKLRLMPIDHILFMTFLYYDGNNDGYICDYDIDRINNLSIKRPVLAYDYQKIKQSGIKKLLTKRESYLELYKYSEVTQTKYFEWKKQGEKDISQGGIELEMKNKILSSKQKQIFLDFDAFCSIFKFQKPFLWYDLIHILSGLQYQGLRYQ